MLIFSTASVLHCKLEKSQLFKAGVDQNMGVGESPMEYLGVPVVRTIILFSHCQPLMEKMLHRFTDLDFFVLLSHVAQLQLINAVIFSIR